MSNRLYPLELDVQRESRLCIRWSDGRQDIIPLAKLRRACPCATCRAMREEQERNPLRVLGALRDVQQAALVGAAELVGNYALRITWRDGHDTGIYDFALLRRLADEEPSKPASERT